MIKVWTDETYPTGEGWDLKEFERFPFKLDNFQKYAIRAITLEENVLVTSQTGSGKTVCAEYAIYYALEHGKKVIYTSPIKSLSNQKFNEFNKKFSGDKVGILTGDIKYNPDAPILIMTTEILRNLLYKDEIKVSENATLKLDIKKDVGVVIFDEVHYINDKERGKVWEECIILLPKEILLVMLSATIDRAEEFGQWIQYIKGRSLNLVGNRKRVIPLKHYFYMTLKGITNNKKIQGMEVEERKYLEAKTDRLIPIMDENGKFYEENVQAIHKIRNKHHDMVDHLGVINNMVEFLRDQEMLPAIFFVFSRNKCEQYAEMLHHTLNSELEQHEAEKTIDYYISKLENKEGYQKLAQFQRIKKLLMRGIGFHHSGLVPIFKEITEILFSKYLLKILFVTETFSVGINLPTKAVVFTGLVKYDSGNKFRILKTFEYRQMSGRAGRRGMDTVGYVIHLPNIGDYPTVGEVRQMMLGNPPPIVSKFSLNYQFVLKAILTENLDQIIRASLWNREIDEKLNNLKQQVTNEDNNTMTKKEIDECKLYESLQNDVMIDGIKLSQNIIKANRKRAQKMMTSAKFKQIYSLYKTMDKELEKKQEIKSDIENMEKYITVELDRILSMLKEFEYIKDDKVTIKGMMASQVNQCQELLLTEMVYQGVFKDLTVEEVVGVLAIFADCKNVGTEVNIPTNKIKIAIEQTEKIAEYLWKAEEKLGIRLDSEWEISRSLVGVAYNWVKKGDIPSGDIIFEGEFIKEMIKICHIGEELEILFDITQNNVMKVIVSDIKSRLMREIVCCDSLYIRGNK